MRQSPSGWTSSCEHISVPIGRLKDAASWGRSEHEAFQTAKTASKIPPHKGSVLRTSWLFIAAPGALCGKRDHYSKQQARYSQGNELGSPPRNRVAVRLALQRKKREKLIAQQHAP